MSDNRPCHCGRLTECPDCWLAVNSPPHRRKWGVESPESVPRPRGPCVHLGTVVEFCLSCKSEYKHVRQCFHPDNPTERCTLGHVAGLTWDCASCPHHVEESE